ncbi:hypothetical protein [Portibacter marinus]|uniref:hypothetical protein n=1 Tax=Portibacter marinus TaxID=2898660 RepID=UPI001F1D1D3E|nr:hypothetical protein [Portibacter marinus]
MKNLLQIILSLWLLSCSPTKQISINEMEGIYLWTSIYGVGETIEFKEDMQFEFKWTQGLKNGITLGTIRNDSKSWILQSELQQESFVFNLEIPSQLSQDFYQFKITDENSIALIGANCETFKDGLPIEATSSNEFGHCKIESINIDSLVINYGGFHPAEIRLTENKTPKSMIIRLKERQFYQYFNGEKIKIISRNKIEISTFGKRKTFNRIKNKT